MVVKVDTAAHHAVVFSLRLISRPALMLVPLEDPLTDPAIDGADAAALLSITHHHKKPALPVAGVGGLNGSLEDPLDEFRGNRVGL